MDEGEWTLIEEGAASMAMEEGVEAEELDWEKPRLRSIGVLEEEDDAAWMLSLAISKLQTHIQIHANKEGREDKCVVN